MKRDYIYKFQFYVPVNIKLFVLSKIVYKGRIKLKLNRKASSPPTVKTAFFKFHNVFCQ